MIWHIAVVDDEIEYIERIEKVVKEFFLAKEMEYVLTSYQQVDMFLNNLPNLSDYILYLLDVEMPEMSGIEIAERIRVHYPQPYIVFITNHLEYAMDAFMVNAFQYIPKRILEERLIFALNHISGRDLHYFERKYLIETNSKCDCILYREIYYIYKEKKYAVIVHRYGESRVRKTLQELFEELDSDEFVFTDKSYIANLQHMVMFRNRGVLMRNHKSIPISAPRAAYVRKSFLDYWKKDM